MQSPNAICRNVLTGHLAYRPVIDRIRAIAVLAVVIFHAFPDTLRSGFARIIESDTPA